MTRNRASAKAAGSRFERTTADYLRDNVDDRIDRKVTTGAKDRGDIGGVRTMFGGRVVVECKDVVKLNLGVWIEEAHDEMGNDDAIAGVICHKRHGKGAPGEQWITMTLADFAAILTGERPQDAPSRPLAAPLTDPGVNQVRKPAGNVRGANRPLRGAATHDLAECPCPGCTERRLDADEAGEP